nr:transposase [Proteiniphilum acetatigenes]
MLLHKGTNYSRINVYRFLTNDFTHSYLTIAELYRGHWQVECFFKWIKQHLHIKSFYGTSQNAVLLSDMDCHLQLPAACYCKEEDVSC